LTFSEENMTRLAGAVSDVVRATRYRLATPRLILVMGMHRSGTSCITRVLNLMGASLGPVNELSSEGSDEVHWESPIVNWINEEMLVRSGGAWHRPPASVQPTRRDYWRCRRFLWELAGTRLAVLKDPRMMVTYPIWKAVLPDHRLVVCLRHPLDVARSLARRDAMSLAQGLDLWLTYNRRLLPHLPEGDSVYWVDFDEGSAGVQRFVHAIAADFPLEPTPGALQYYSPSTHHHRERGTLPVEVQQLYAEMKRRARAGIGRASTPSPVRG
jgi:hypothetical protein